MNMNELVLQTKQSAETLNLQVNAHNYDGERAIRYAAVIINDLRDRDGNPALEVCEKNTIKRSLMDMIFRKLDPVKKQCNFIVRNKEVKRNEGGEMVKKWIKVLSLEAGYFGNVAEARREGLVDFVARVRYKNDIFEVKHEGMATKVHHIRDFNSELTDIIGAYVIAIDKNGREHFEYMTMKEIKTAWEQGSMKGNSDAHNNFTGEMCKKTVISRITKHFNSSTDDENSENTASENIEYSNYKAVGSQFNVPEIKAPEPEPEPKAEAKKEPAAKAPERPAEAPPKSEIKENLAKQVGGSAKQETKQRTLTDEFNDIDKDDDRPF